MCDENHGLKGREGTSFIFDTNFSYHPPVPQLGCVQPSTVTAKCYVKVIGLFFIFCSFRTNHPVYIDCTPSLWLPNLMQHYSYAIQFTSLWTLLNLSMSFKSTFVSHSNTTKYHLDVTIWQMYKTILNLFCRLYGKFNPSSRVPINAHSSTRV